VLDSNGKVSVRDLLNRSPKDEWSEEDLASVLNDHLRTYQRAFETLEKLPAHILDKPWGNTMALISRETKLAEGESLIFESVFAELGYRRESARAEERAELSPYRISVPPIRPSTFVLSRAEERRSDLVNEVEAARRAREAAELDIQRAIESIDTLPGSKELYPGFAVLGVFSITGVVVPLVMIATQESPVLSFTRKVVCLAGFVIGLLVLGAYLFRQIRSLDRSS
jgi:hypothetical protein